MWQKKMTKRCQCTERELLLTAFDTQLVLKDFDYLSKLSRGGLTIPSVDLAHYVSKSFAMLDTANEAILKSTLIERVADEEVLMRNPCAQSFLCQKHMTNLKFVNRIACNVYFNNAQKLAVNEVRKDAVQ